MALQDMGPYTKCRGINHSDQQYFGLASYLRQRFANHNAGRTAHTSKFRPRIIETYVAFSDEHRAEKFEKYMTSGSGGEFSGGHL
jgi:predicted GIY-YIG superfamily endonuclease